MDKVIHSKNSSIGKKSQNVPAVKSKIIEGPSPKTVNVPFNKEKK